MLQFIVLGCILFVSIYTSKRSQDSSNLNLPPLVRYNIPIIGHTFSYMFNCEEFFLQCKEEYGDIFRIYVWGNVKTVVGREHAQEVLNRNDVFDFGQAFKHIFPKELEFIVISATRNTVAAPIKLAKDVVFNKLEFYTERIQERLHYATQKYLGDCDKPTTFYNINNTMTRIMAVPIASILVSVEASEYDDIITTFTDFTSDVGKIIGIPPIFDLIYSGLQNYVNGAFVRMFDPISKHQNTLLKHVKSQVDKRLQEKQKYGDSWNRPNDALQDFLESDWIDINNIDYGLIVNRIIALIFVSVHSTSRSCTNVVVDLASHPEYMQELYEEQLEVSKQADENGILPSEALNDMKKLDSLVRESLRLTGHIASLPHLTLSDFTFSDGIQVPKNKVIEIYNDDINRDESLHGPNPREFAPFRHLDKNSQASKVNKGYVLFGGGKRACPGRYFAVNEMKFFLHNAILKYNIRTESGKVEKKWRLGTMSMPSKAGIVFEKRI